MGGHAARLPNVRRPNRIVEVVSWEVVVVVVGWACSEAAQYV